MRPASPRSPERRPVTSHYAFILVFAIIGAAFAAGGMILVRIFAPSRPYPEKLSTYECGADPIGDAWVQFNVRYYLFAILFIVFDVETVFMFPWARVFGRLESLGVPVLYGLWEGLLFIAVLLLGYVYAWRKGILEWV